MVIWIYSGLLPDFSDLTLGILAPSALPCTREQPGYTELAAAAAELVGVDLAGRIHLSQGPAWAICQHM